MRRRIFWSATGLLVLAASWLLWNWLIPPFPIRAYERLRLGMTQEEVETAIGLPPGYYDGVGPMPVSMSGIVSIFREAGLPSNKLSDARNANDDSRVTIQFWVWEDYCIWTACDP